MSNVLSEVQSLIAPAKTTAKIGVVTSLGAAGTLTVETSSGVEYIVSGIAQRNDTVLFDDAQVVYLLKRETLRTYYIK